MSTSVTARKRVNAGTSLVEILVVIVVFLIGILAIVQIFPGGFKILDRTRDQSIGQELARGLTQSLSASPSTLPEAILPLATSTTISVDSTRTPLDMSIYDQGNTTINKDGTITYKGTQFGNYAYYSGANVFRYVKGEGVPVPPPSIIGNFYGGLAFLRFAPLRMLTNDAPSLDVYSAGYQITTLSSANQIANGLVVYGQAYLIDPNNQNGGATLYIQIDQASATSPAFIISGNVFVGTNQEHIQSVVTPATPGVTVDTVNQRMIVPLTAVAGGAFSSVDPNGLIIQRQFDQLAPSATFSNTDPYEYKVLNQQLGELLFNPIGYNYRIRTSSGKDAPLQAYVDYVVQDWRILHNTFRTDDSSQDYRTTFGSIKVLNTQYEDNLPYQGIGVQEPNATASALQNTDVLFVDQATGGIVSYDPSNPAGPVNPNSVNGTNIDPTKSSVFVDKSTGTIHFLDYDSDPTNGTQIRLMLPDPNAPSGFDPPVTVNLSGRVIKAYYMARGDWSLAPNVELSQFYPTSGRIGPNQYLVGTGTRIYLPPMMLGSHVTIQFCAYLDGSGNAHTFQDQNLIVRSSPADSNGPFVDIRDVDPSAVGFDNSRGYAVQGVVGASVGAHVYDNPTHFQIGSGAAANTNAFNSFQQGWVREIVDTFAPYGGQ